MGKLNNEEAFRHINYHSTDVRKTWARERKRLAEAAAKQAQQVSASQAIDDAIKAEAVSKVRVLKAGTA